MSQPLVVIRKVEVSSSKCCYFLRLLIVPPLRPHQKIVESPTLDQCNPLKRAYAFIRCVALLIAGFDSYLDFQPCSFLRNMTFVLFSICTSFLTCCPIARKSLYRVSISLRFALM